MNLNLITDEDAAKVVGAVRASHSSSADLATDAKKAAVGETPQVAADDVYSKLLKLVPIPIYAPYLTIESLLLSSVSSDDRLKILFVDLSAKQWACWATLVLFAALVPWYLARGGVVRARQLIVTTVGFMVFWTDRGTGAVAARPLVA